MCLTVWMYSTDGQDQRRSQSRAPHLCNWRYRFGETMVMATKVLNLISHTLTLPQLGIHTRDSFGRPHRDHVVEHAVQVIRWSMCSVYESPVTAGWRTSTVISTNDHRRLCGTVTPRTAHRSGTRTIGPPVPSPVGLGLSHVLSSVL